MKDEHFDGDLTKKCAECGSYEEMRWLELHPSFCCVPGFLESINVILVLVSGTHKLETILEFNC